VCKGQRPGHSHNHCRGAYQKDGYLFGDAYVGSAYLVKKAFKHAGKYKYKQCLHYPRGWARPNGNVPISAGGVDKCNSICGSRGYRYFGLECPMGSQVHCQCSNGLQGNPSPVSVCQGQRPGHSHNHCRGAYEKDGYLFGDAHVGSAYEVVKAKNLVINGNFESGWRRPWKMVHRNQYLDQPGGWQVTTGNIDFGDYRTGGHCYSNCAHGGQSFIDMCGGTRGAIAQTLHTRNGVRYKLTMWYESHAGCAGRANMRMDVLVDGRNLRTLSHANHRGWRLAWKRFDTYFTARSTRTKLELRSQDSRCGCMLIDDVEVWENR